MPKTDNTYSLEEFYDRYGKNAEFLTRADKLVLAEGLAQKLLGSDRNKVRTGLVALRLRVKKHLSVKEQESLLEALTTQVKQGVYAKN